ncbi:hypothetical protein, partial [Blastococcus sp. CT_GayMR16]|uniref:hypothetical protein n=1 Tax=Blastococcus sp. CT_GayMR16 TaxID=2559607 RepID=UPI00110270A8
MICAGLLIAAPLAFVLTDDPEAGQSRDSDGVFTGTTNDGTAGRGAGGPTSVATTSSQSPAAPAGDPAANADQAAAVAGTDGSAGGAAAAPGWDGG